MNVRFTPEALNHIDSIQQFIEDRDPEAARRVAQRIYATADRLGAFPRLGHPGIVAGTYELVVRPLPCILVHELDRTADEVVILAVFHGAQPR